MDKPLFESLVPRSTLLEGFSVAKGEPYLDAFKRQEVKMMGQSPPKKEYLIPRFLLPLGV